MTFTLGQLSELLDCELQGDADKVITGIAPLDMASGAEISFLANPLYLNQLKATEAGAVILHADYLADSPCDILVCDNPYLAYAHLSMHFMAQPAVSVGGSATAQVDSTAQVADTAMIGPGCIISRGAKIADGVTLLGNVFVGENSTIGKNTFVYHGVSIYSGVQVGINGIIHSGTVIGSDGFGFAPDKQGKFHKIAQLGGVEIGDNVEIGANVTIDRGALRETRIEDGVKLDNQVQVGHNVHIGAHTVVAGCAAIAGSTKIGRHCMIGGAVGIAGHLEITDGVQLTGMAMVTHSISKPGAYSSGTGLSNNAKWRRNVARFRQLDKLHKKVTVLEKQIKALSQE